LRDSTALLGDVAALRERMAEDGYLLLRRLFPREVITEGRRELCEKLSTAGLIDRRYPLTEAIFSGDTSQAEAMDRWAFAKYLRTGEALRRICHGPDILALMERFLGGEPLAFSYIWVRNNRVGRSTPVHFDWVFMSRGTPRLYTAWIPYGDVPLHEGPLAVLGGSHTVDELQRTYGSYDVDRDKLWHNEGHRYRDGWLTKEPAVAQRQLGGRWLTTDFEAGDLLLFGMFMIHCAIDNKSPENRIRLSTDSRYQLASEPADERWVGEDPFGHGMI
jgi:ectoine hydroxylase-related dioxygenase (phytanoyl-CoA dioxygenase family)